MVPVDMATDHGNPQKMENGETRSNLLPNGTAHKDEKYSGLWFRLEALAQRCAVLNLLLVVLLVITVVILIIILAARPAKQTPPCPSFPPPVTAACPDSWVGFQGKCFYLSEMEGNWSASQNHCASLNASLATVDSLPELAFMLRYRGIPFCWIGLQREQDQGQPWKWTNGTIFNNLFRVRGERQCAYLDDREVSSARCYVEMHFICSRPDECSRRKLSATGGDTI